MLFFFLRVLLFLCVCTYTQCMSNSNQDEQEDANQYELNESQVLDPVRTFD